MSKESVKKFIVDAQRKPEIKAIFQKTTSNFDSKEAKREYIATEAKKRGYNFTTDELKTVLTEETEKMSDDDLDSVAGGTWIGKLVKIAGNFIGDLL